MRSIRANLVTGSHHQQLEGGLGIEDPQRLDDEARVHLDGREGRGFDAGHQDLVGVFDATGQARPVQVPGGADDLPGPDGRAEGVNGCVPDPVPDGHDVAGARKAVGAHVGLENKISRPRLPSSGFESQFSRFDFEQL